jgi:hypothetical protein
MKRDTAIAAGVTLGITASLVLSVTLTVLFIVGWKTERETSDTTLTLQAAAKLERHTDRQVQEGSNQSQQTPPDAPVAPAEPPAKAPEAKRDTSAATSYVGGNYVSARSSIRYVLEDVDGRVNMYGYDVMRGRRVFTGSGRMTGRRLTIPNFYSFLDDTHGTLKLNLSDDGKTFEGRFEGLDSTKEGPVTLIRLP